MGTSILMMKTQIGLGVLSIPLVFDTLGMIPGIIVLLGIAIITTWVRETFVVQRWVLLTCHSIV